MREILFGLLLVGIATPVAADRCAKHGELAATILETRYAGASMSQVMTTVTESSTDDLGRTMARDLVIEAYEVPSYSSDKYRIRAIQDFRTRAELFC